MQLHKDGDSAIVSSRNGFDLTRRFPMFQDIVHSLPAVSAISDAELVACDTDGKPDFNALDPTQVAARKAARDVEQLTMSDPERAIFELSNRIDNWITVHPDGAILVIERQDGRWTESYALPKSAPWTVRCMPNGIRVTVSNLFEGDQGATGAVISKKLTRAKFTEEHCAQILPALARKLQDIFSSRITAQR